VKRLRPGPVQLCGRRTFDHALDQVDCRFRLGLARFFAFFFLGIALGQSRGSRSNKTRALMVPSGKCPSASAEPGFGTRSKPQLLVHVTDGVDIEIAVRTASRTVRRASVGHVGIAGLIAPCSRSGRGLAQRKKALRFFRLTPPTACNLTKLV